MQTSGSPNSAEELRWPQIHVNPPFFNENRTLSGGVGAPQFLESCATIYEICKYILHDPTGCGSRGKKERQLVRHWEIEFLLGHARLDIYLVSHADHWNVRTSSSIHRFQADSPKETAETRVTGKQCAYHHTLLAFAQQICWNESKENEGESITEYR